MTEYGTLRLTHKNNDVSFLNYKYIDQKYYSLIEEEGTLDKYFQKNEHISVSDDYNDKFGVAVSHVYENDQATFNLFNDLKEHHNEYFEEYSEKFKIVELDIKH